MNQVLSFLLTLVVTYGYPIIAGAIFASSFGVPLPANAILLASGSLSVEGGLNIYLLIIFISLTAITGDLIVYYLGRRYGERLLETIIPKLGISTFRLDSIDRLLRRWGSWYIFITRWLLTPLGVPVNLLAGSRRYPFRKFLGIAAIGEILWVTLYTSLGYIFGTNWSALLDYLNGTPQVLTLFLIGIGFFLVAYNLRRR